MKESFKSILFLVVLFLRLVENAQFKRNDLLLIRELHVTFKV